VQTLQLFRSLFVKHFGLASAFFFRYDFTDFDRKQVLYVLYKEIKIHKTHARPITMIVHFCYTSMTIVLMGRCISIEDLSAVTDFKGYGSDNAKPTYKLTHPAVNPLTSFAANFQSAECNI